MSGRMKRMGEGTTSWVWQDEEKAEPVEYEVDVGFEDLGEEETPNLDPLLYWEKNAGPVNQASGGYVFPTAAAVIDYGQYEAEHPFITHGQRRMLDHLAGKKEPKHTIPPLDPESALAKCHALIQEQASELGEEMLARVEAEEKLECVSADLYSLNKTFKRVQGNADRYHENWQDAAAQLKIMTEDRDEYQDLYRQALSAYAEVDSTATVSLIVLALVGSSKDEQAMVLTYARKLMGEGRSEHGPLDLATDDRDLLGEGLDELDDVMSYLMMVKRRLELRRKADQCNAEGVHYCDGTNQCT